MSSESLEKILDMSFMPSIGSSKARDNSYVGREFGLYVEIDPYFMIPPPGGVRNYHEDVKIYDFKDYSCQLHLHEDSKGVIGSLKDYGEKEGIYIDAYRSSMLELDAQNLGIKPLIRPYKKGLYD